MPGEHGPQHGRNARVEGQAQDERGFLLQDQQLFQAGQLGFGVLNKALRVFCHEYVAANRRPGSHTASGKLPFSHAATGKRPFLAPEAFALKRRRGRHRACGAVNGLTLMASLT
jgi:hypothetical protein